MSNRSDYQLNTIKNEKTRSCGNCDACCTVLSISCLDKPAGVRCSHLIQNSEDQAGAGACSIYDDRPEPCAGFVCVWLRDNIGLLSEEDRPDLSGILFTASVTNF